MNPWGPFLEQNPKRKKIHGKKTKIKQNTGKNRKKARPSSPLEYPWGPFLEQNPKRKKIHGKKQK